METKAVRRADGTSSTIDLYARAGAIGTGTLTADGTIIFTPLLRIRTHRNADKTGYRWYNDYRLPDNLGGGVVTVRLHANASDAARKFNRTEDLRPIAPEDPAFGNCSGDVTTPNRSTVPLRTRCGLVARTASVTDVSSSTCSATQ